MKSPLPTHWRGDIQGLRAVAVGLVIADHVFHWPFGGFIGVDVFFVISGFLIGGLLLREVTSTGSISFKNFYVRRARRILPASLATLFVTAFAFALVIGGQRGQAVLIDSAYALAFAANIHFAASGTDYFAAGQPPSPLQHFWSLAVEEQFYLAWPALLLITFLLCRRWKRSFPAAMLMLSTFLVATSLAWSIWSSGNSPTTAYFSTFTRAWELGLGAALAGIMGWLQRLPKAVLVASSWAGLAGILLSSLVFSAATVFPGAAAALPVVSASLVIAGGSRASRWSPNTLILANPVFRYFGNASYSLYLWHWPIYVFAGALYPLANFSDRIIVLILGVAISLLSFHFIERPVLKSSWLLGAQSRATAARGRVNSRGKVKAGIRRNQWVATSCALLAATAVSASLVHSHNLRSAEAASVSATAVQEITPVSPASPNGSSSHVPSSPLEAAIAAAVSANRWPDANPPLSDAVGKNDISKDIASCASPAIPVTTRCTWGDAGAAKTAVIIGDSTAVAYTTALRSVAEGSAGQWKFISEAMFGCTFVDADIPNVRNAEASQACPGRREHAAALINEIKPQAVIITNTYEPRMDANGKILSDAEWTRALASYVDSFRQSVGKIIYLATPPSGKDVQKCYTLLSRPADCLTHVSSSWASRAEAEKKLASEEGGAYVDSRPWFCDALGRCPAFVGSSLVKFDLVHITATYATEITPEVRASLADAGIQ
ncbi:acyltransferase family protein [Quadrisphaera granulorum]|nr:acyltransferase family protein [Quadrisphaera granulorum]